MCSEVNDGAFDYRNWLPTFFTLKYVLVHSGLPCFRPNALRNLQARFFPELDEAGAAVKMMEIVENANQKWTTNGYDGIQWQQQGIWYWGTEKQ